LDGRQEDDIFIVDSLAVT